MFDGLPIVALITDDLLVRSRLESLIAEAGATVRVAGTSESAANLLSEATPASAFVLDLSARIGNPQATIARLRERFPSAPIVAFGAHTDRESLAEAARRGCTLVLPRSRAVRELGRELSRLLRA